MKIITLLIALVVGSLTASADVYSEGSKVDAFSAEDQHGKSFTLDPSSTRFLLVSHDMDTGKAANGVLTTLGTTYLSDRKAYYVANIHGMPGVGRMFALPKMRKYAHRIILGDDEALIAKFPAQQGKVTVLKLYNGKVSSIKYWDPASGTPDPLLK
jgi:streptogramin lyase